MRRGLGWLPDPPKHDDEQPDFDLETLGLDMPPHSASLRPFVVDVLDQGRLGACVAHAGFQAIRIAHVRQAAGSIGLLGAITSPAATAAVMIVRANPPPLGSRLWGYYFARAIHHMTAFDSGTHLRSFYSAINALGFPPECAWLYSDDKSADRPKFTRQPKTNAFRLAADQRMPATYRRIFSTGASLVNDIRRAVANGFAVTFGVDVDADFCDNLFDPTRPLDPIRGAVVGGHAMTVVGYAGDVFDVLNSWGEHWGDGGYFAASAEYIATIRDVWTVEHVPHYAIGP